MPTHRREIERQYCEEMYEEAFESFHTKKGTPYQCSENDINFHARNFLSLPTRGPFVSDMEATMEVVSQNSRKRRSGSTESNAIDNLLDAIDYAKGNGFGPDLAVKAFSDLDLVFFGGQLQGNVCVSWHHDDHFDHDALAQTLSLYPGQCRIELNAKTILIRSSTDRVFKKMFGTLLHEMCHAYEFVRAPRSDYDESYDTHDEHFRTKVHAVHQRSTYLLGLEAIEEGEPYMENHLMSQHWQAHQDGGRRSRRKRYGRSSK